MDVQSRPASLPGGLFFPLIYNLDLIEQSCPKRKL
jgi:hypothetical protein